MLSRDGNKFIYIAIDGVIRVTNTTLARMLHPILGDKVLVEVCEENPLSSDLYVDRTCYAFQMQLCVLLRLCYQHRWTLPYAPANVSRITDYPFGRGPVSARVKLSAGELATYEQINDTMGERISQPDLVVYIRSCSGRLVQRIATRDHTHSRGIDRDSMCSLRCACDRQLLTPAQDQTTITLDTIDLNFVARRHDFSLIVDLIGATLICIVQTTLLMVVDESRR